jgi:hypothetical protein
MSIALWRSFDMCTFPNFGINMEYLHDLRRGRHDAPGRFIRIDEYAYKHWIKARDLRHARQWLMIMEAVKRRSPTWLGVRYSLDRPPFTLDR